MQGMTGEGIHRDQTGYRTRGKLDRKRGGKVPGKTGLSTRQAGTNGEDVSETRQGTKRDPTPGQTTDKAQNQKRQNMAKHHMEIHPGPRVLQH